MAAVTAFGIFAIVVMGGVVRVTESGLGCPDWPLCDGELTPRLESAALIEYTHRMIVAVVGFLVLATAVTAWVDHRGERWIVWPAAAALLLVILQAGLGGATVESELEPNLVVTHLGIAMVFLLSALLPLFPRAWSATNTAAQEELAPWLFLVAGVTLATMLLGAYIGSSGAGLACPDLPICDGDPVSLSNRYVQVHMMHRALAVVDAVLIMAIHFRASRLRPRRLWLSAFLGLASLSVLLQIFLGAINVWLEIPEGVVVAHLANGAILWALASSAAMILIRGRSFKIGVRAQTAIRPVGQGR